MNERAQQAINDALHGARALFQILRTMIAHAYAMKR